MKVLSVKELSAEGDVDDEGEQIASLFNGYTPVLQNPLIIVSGFTARYTTLWKIGC